MIYRGKAHREMFRQAIERENGQDKGRLAVLYLLTADKRLWSKVRHTVGEKRIPFSAVYLGNASPEAYTLFMTAWDMYEGTKHISVNDIADREIVSHKMFGIICNAMAICRYGADALGAFDKDSEDQ